MEAVSPDDGPVTPPSGHTPALHWGAPVVCVQGLGLIATEFYYTMQVGAPPWTPTLCAPHTYSVTFPSSLLLQASV